MWAAVSKTWKSPLIFVPQCAKFNIWTRILRQFWLLPLQRLRNTLSKSRSHCRQDGAPSHTSYKTQEWCKNHFPHFWSKKVLSPSSPDLNPMDFCVWFILEAGACASSHDSVEVLKGSLKKAWDKIPQEGLRKAVDSFTCRLERVIQGRRGHIQ